MVTRKLPTNKINLLGSRKLCKEAFVVSRFHKTRSRKKLFEDIIFVKPFPSLKKLIRNNIT